MLTSYRCSGLALYVLLLCSHVHTMPEILSDGLRSPIYD